MWGGRPRPPTLFADVLTTRDPTLVKRHDECSTSICHSESAPVHLVIPNPLQRCQYTRPCTLSFRIRFSGEESAFPANRFRKRASPLSRRALPALCPKQIRIRVRLQASRHGRTPAAPRPSGATATAPSSALPLIRTRQRMARAFKSLREEF